VKLMPSQLGGVAPPTKAAPTSATRGPVTVIVNEVLGGTISPSSALKVAELPLSVNAPAAG
jgi:hypothetical protein